MDNPGVRQPFRSRQRHESGEETRAKILRAARSLIAAPGGFSQFSIDAVARNAGVARMTVYYQFGSRRGLFEALFDNLAANAGFGSLAGFGAAVTSDEALEAFLHFFCNFWSGEQLVLRRLRGLATLDPELGEALAERDDRRKLGVTMLVNRIRGEQPSNEQRVAALLAVTSFETFDALSRGRTVAEAEAIMLDLARAAIGIPVTQRP